MEAVTAVTWETGVATLRSRIGAWAGPGRASDAGTSPGLYCNV